MFKSLQWWGGGEEPGDDFRELAQHLEVPLVHVDEAVRLHYEEDWREQFEVDQFWPLWIVNPAGGVLLVTDPPQR